MEDEDLIYYQGRAEAERALAEESGREDIAAIHVELATLNEALVAHEELRVTGRPSLS